MFKNRGIFFIIILIAAVSCACQLLSGSQPNAPDAPDEEDVDLSDFGEEFPDVDIPGLEPAEWPSYIPSEIPELEGNIGMVMVAPESHVRLFYEDLKEDDILLYLETLESEGYSLEYLVYAQEGFEDSAEERAAAGEYDAVGITNGVYRMRLEFGGDSAVYDIYSDGFTIPDESQPAWPEELAGLLPQPEGCPLKSVVALDAGEYRINCEMASGNTSADYVVLLQQNGFAESDCSSLVYEFGQPQTLALGNLCVTVLTLSDTEMQIEVRKSAASDSDQWPEILRGVVPVPERATIVSVLPVSETDYNIMAAADDAAVVQEYLDTLEESGFSVVESFKGQTGELLQVTLTDEVWIMEIMPASMGMQLIMHIYQE